MKIRYRSEALSPIYFSLKSEKALLVTYSYVLIQIYENYFNDTFFPLSIHGIKCSVNHWKSIYRRYYRKIFT